MTLERTEIPLWHGAGEAPAKINLGLHVVGRTADGYHDIRTVMVGLELADSLEIEAQWGHPHRPENGPAMELLMDGETEGVVADDTNLVLRAARLLLGRALRRLAIGMRGEALAPSLDATVPVLPDLLRFRLRKRVPVEGGLGGGSSDAAATLRLLDALPGARFAAHELREMAATLGSDVPYALAGGCMLAEGRGERLTPLPDVPPWFVVLVRPEVSVSTPWCYRRWDELHGGGQEVDGSATEERNRRMARIVQALRQGDLEGIGQAMFNDLQEPVVQAWPELERLPGLLREAGCPVAAMTGSGSCFYGLAAAPDVAQRAAAMVSERGLGRAWVTRLRTATGSREEA